MDVHFLGHACFELSDGDETVLIDPFLTGNPKAAIAAEDAAATTILLTHGHADHIGDTCLFSDLQLAGRRGDGVDVALVPIGGHYTMDRIDAVEAVRLVNPRSAVIPCHYNTFPPIETDAEAFKHDVESDTSAQVQILQPGESFTP